MLVVFLSHDPVTPRLLELLDGAKLQENAKETNETERRTRTRIWSAHATESRRQRLNAARAVRLGLRLVCQPCGLSVAVYTAGPPKEGRGGRVTAGTA